ncbi:MAG: pentapeptide repeat-containing protein [Thermomicrobiales bacterium]
MDRERFDALTRMLAAPASRRKAVAALFGIGITGSADLGAAKQKRRKTQGGKVSAQASTCDSPGPGKNLSGCDYRGDDFSGQSLAGANLNAAIFVDATMVSANLSGASAKGTRFADADLCGATLRSAVLKQADFRGADLTRADLRAAVCAGAEFTAATFCQTVTCEGTVRNDGCPSGVDPKDVCCTTADCSGGRECRDGLCVCDVCASGCPYTSLAAAVAGTAAGGTIRICAGTYGTFDVTIAKNLTIIGAGSGSDPGKNTILESNRLQQVLIIESGTVGVRDLRITKGHSDLNGGGIGNSGSLTLRNVTVIDNTADDHGGGIENNGTLTLANGTVVTGNRASFDGGGLVNNAGTARLEAGSQVTGNTAGDRGGGVFEEGGVVDVANTSIVTGNTPNNCRPEGAVPNCIG